MSFSRKTVGDLGEILTTFFLTKITKKDVQISWVGSSNLGYDILIPFPDRKVFEKPTAISVKTRKMRTAWKGIPPNKKAFDKMQDEFKKKRWSFWVALVLYDIEEREMWFRIHLIPSDIITSEWFVRVGKKRQICIERIEEESKKANTRILTFASRSCQESDL